MGDSPEPDESDVVSRKQQRMGEQGRALHMITCIDESVYSDSLTRGRSYPILDRDIEKQQLRVRNDNGRVRWFPESCFDMTGGAVPRLVRVTVEDVDRASHAAVEVRVELSNGQRRWCFFVTPEGLSRLSQAQLAEERLIIYAAPHMIVVSAITEQVINQALHHIDAQNELMNATRRLS